MVTGSANDHADAPVTFANASVTLHYDAALNHAASLLRELRVASGNWAVPAAAPRRQYVWRWIPHRTTISSVCTIHLGRRRWSCGRWRLCMHGHPREFLRGTWAYARFLNHNHAHSKALPLCIRSATILQCARRRQACCACYCSVCVSVSMAMSIVVCSVLICTVTIQLHAIK